MKNFFCTLLLAVIFFSLFYSSSIFANDNYAFIDNENLVISGIDYSSGYYGLKHKTEMLYIPMLFKKHHNNWNLSLTLAYLKMTGPGGVYGGGDGGVIPTGDGQSGNSHLPTNPSGQSGQGNNKPESGKMVTNEGIGDALFKVSYELDRYFQLPYLLELGGQVKIPLADKDKELGTGEFDWSMSLDLANSYGSFSPFMTLGYKFMGDPETINLNNVYFYSLGLDYKLSYNFHTGIIYDYKQKVLSSSYEISESTLYLNWSINHTLSMNSYIVSGFSQGSPDWATGVQFSLSF